MGRKKIEMGKIENKRTLRRTFHNRKQGLMKKASELSKLCDVETCVIIFGPNGDHAPHVWPKEPEKLNNSILRYQNTSVEERRKRATNLSTFIDSTKMISPSPNEHLVKVTMPENQSWDPRIDSFSVDQLVALVNCLDSKLEIVKDRIGMMKTRSGYDQFQGIREHEEEEEKMNVMPMMNMIDHQMGLPNLGSYDQYHHQQLSAGLNLMMVNGGNGGFMNPMNVDMSLLGMGVMQGPPNPTPVTWYYDPAQLMQASQAVDLPFYM